MSHEITFRCPVCRATQPPQPECRRCKADLCLTLRARQRLVYLLEQRATAIYDGDWKQKKRIQSELDLLAPQQSIVADNV